MIPLAPERLSTTTCWLNASARLELTIRASISVPAPAPNGTIRRIGRLGYGCCGCAEADAMNANEIMAARSVNVVNSVAITYPFDLAQITVVGPVARGHSTTAP